MAALAASAVTLYPTDGSGEFFTMGLDNRSIITRRLKLVLTGQGGLTNTIGASALGFSKLLWCGNLVDDQNDKGYPAVVDPVNNQVILYDGAAAPAPVDVTSSASYIVVTGTAKIT